MFKKSAAKGESIKHKGKLTQRKIAQFQEYYTNTIVKSDTVKDMQLRIKAILLHCMSSENDQYLMCCPYGTDS